MSPKPGTSLYRYVSFWKALQRGFDACPHLQPNGVIASRRVLGLLCVSGAQTPRLASSTTGAARSTGFRCYECVWRMVARLAMCGTRSRETQLVFESGGSIDLYL